MGTHLITGAGSGIGAAVAERLAERGEQLWLLARDAKRAAQLRERFPGSNTLIGDLGTPDRLSWALGQQTQPVELDSLLHIAGVVQLGTVGDLTTKVWNETLAVNLIAPAELTRLFLPTLRVSRGQVVFVNSGSGLAAHPEWGPYAASKHGLRALADALRGEEHGNGVRVTSVYPGRTATAMQQRVRSQEGLAYDADAYIAPESVAAAVLTALDLPRDAEITDLTVRPGR
ncbi:SDR family oxidoreductase [Streptacidiphilus sp. PB12-B1b]|uniref:SDR family oxidoreductase n=1 Tax=Streptacidiphilus sp. PB12-B1b TaxID=2705012 RepID=UPI0015F895C6|nr:SDR family oxidoreductase [Streptacidiphilus sp. PB12-B1b]QMU78987.1 SDR family oxidoreductase [Streptacidiphilus sp. PB12-B1b]